MNSANLIVSIDNVANGLSCDCDCTCLDCGTLLVEKQGDFQAHDFVHSPEEHSAKLYKWSYETDLYIIAKEVLRQTKL
jgi:hypothetical protein